MNKLLTIGFLILLSGCASSTELMETELPKNYEDVKHWYNGWFKHDMRVEEIQPKEYKLTCFIPSSTTEGCRKQAEQVCEENGYPTRKVFNAKKMCVSQEKYSPGIHYGGCFHQWDIRCGGPVRHIGRDEVGNVVMTIKPIPKPDPIRNPYFQIKYNYIMDCGHWQSAAECRKKAIDVCEDNNFTFQKMAVHDHICANIGPDEPDDYVHCISNLKIHCTGREDL